MDLERRICDKDHHSTERDHELLWHRSLLREAKEATIAKARQLEDFQAAKAQEIEDLHDEL
jgi:hypothetical protein